MLNGHGVVPAVLAFEVRVAPKVDETTGALTYQEIEQDVRFVDKVAPTIALAKHLGLLREKVDHKHEMAMGITPHLAAKLPTETLRRLKALSDEAKKILGVEEGA